MEKNKKDIVDELSDVYIDAAETYNDFDTWTLRAAGVILAAMGEIERLRDKISQIEKSKETS
jgi:uncharacterized protein (UPF0335 family)